MSLALLSTNDERLVGTAVEGLVRGSVAHGSALLLVPSFSDVLYAQKDLAHYEGLSLGVEVATPCSWARGRWEVWGDGRRAVEAPVRTLLVTGMLKAAPTYERGPLEAVPGTVRIVCGLAEQALPWVSGALETPDGMGGLSKAEQCAVRLLGRYAHLLLERGLIEDAEILKNLPGVLEQVATTPRQVVVSGFEELSRAERELLVGLARSSQVTLVYRGHGGIACRKAAHMAHELATLAEERGVSVEHSADAGPEGVCERLPELASLEEALFDPTAPRVIPSGAVRLLEPSGPLAEAELVAQEACALAAEGLCSQVVAVPDVRRAWRELVPKLTSRNISVRAQMSVPVLQTRAGASFMGYARAVARLVELAATWPEPVPREEGELVRVGDMTWWPPHDLVDFMLSDVSHVAPERARALDVAWRSNRLLGPADVLAHLLSAKLTSDAVERATRELLRGRLGSAASKLLAPFVQDKGAHDAAGEHDAQACASLMREEAVGALTAVLGVAASLKELGIAANPATEPASLSELVSQAELALGSARVVLRPRVQVEREEAQVLVLDRGQAACLPAASHDALIACGLTSEELAVPTGDDVLSGLLAELGVEGHADPMVGMRTTFARLCAVPRKRLLLERTLFSHDAEPTYPAVMLTEILACYNEPLPRTTLDEQAARADLAVLGREPQPVTQEGVGAAGTLDVSLRRLVTVPQEGKAELEGGLPVLSASQLESYLECPFKWFSLRRLGLRDNDAGFGPLETGTFAHRVLELTHAQLLDEACAAAGVERDLGANLAIRLPGSRVGDGGAQDCTHAKEVLASTFDAHLAHQYLRSGNHAAYQALIAHTAEEEGKVERLRQDLLSAVEYEAGRLRGFEPRLFEWEFGRGDDQTSYAGVRVTGTVDRVDVNAHGQAIVIDYKHKGRTGFFSEYAALPEGGYALGTPFVLPRRIQALLYAQVIRRAFPNLQVVGALYLATRAPHELSGAVDANQVENVFGVQPRQGERVAVEPEETFGREGVSGMNALLDATEEAVAAQVERLRAGNIEAHPVDEAACAYCPVMNCERRVRR